MLLFPAPLISGNFLGYTLSSCKLKVTLLSDSGRHSLFPLQSKIKVYIILSIMIDVILLVSLFMINTAVGSLLASYKIANATLIAFLNKIYIFAIAVSAAALVFGGYTFIMTYARGMNRYRELSKRLASLLEQEDFNIKSIEFPREDEFGNMGQLFNQLLNKLERFDQLKTERARVENRKFEELAERTEVPILVVGIQHGDKMVKYYNSNFETIFAKKPGETNQYYDIRNFNLKALSIAAQDNETAEAPKGIMAIFNRLSDSEMIDSFIDKEFDNAIDISIADRTLVEIKKDIRSMSGLDLYRSDHIEIVPFWDDQGVTVDVMIFFNKIKHIKGKSA